MQGPTDQGFLLPNGWTLKPAGEQSRWPTCRSTSSRWPTTATRSPPPAATTPTNCRSSTCRRRRSSTGRRSGRAGSAWPSARGGPDLVVGRRRQCAARVSTLADHRLTRDRRPEPPQARARPASRAISAAGIALDPRRKVLYSLDVDAGTITCARPRRPEGDQVRAGRHAALRRRRRPERHSALRLRLGRPGRPRPRPGRPAHRRPDRRRRASQPDRRPPRGRPDLRRLRVEQLRLGHRHPARDRHRDDPHGPLPRAPEGSTPDALAIAPDGKTLFVANADNNCVAVIDIATPSRSQVKGFIPTGWYPTAVAVTPDGKPAGRRRQGKPDQGQPDRAGQRPKAKTESDPVAKTPSPAVTLHRHDALRIAVDRPDPRRQGPGPVHRDGLQELPVFRQAAHRRSLSREDRHPHQGRRPVADQARALHHQGEPDLRPGLRRHRPGATATRRW